MKHLSVGEWNGKSVGTVWCLEDKADVAVPAGFHPSSLCTIPSAPIGPLHLAFTFCLMRFLACDFVCLVFLFNLLQEFPVVGQRCVTSIAWLKGVVRPTE